MDWVKLDNLMECATYYVNRKNGKQIKISYLEQMTRKTRKFEKLRKIREHKRLLFQIKFFLYRETVQDKQSFNFCFDPIGSDNLFNKINNIDLKKYKFGTVKSVLKYIYTRDTQSIHSFMDDFFSVLPPQDIKYKEDILQKPYTFTWFVANNIKFFDKFNLLSSLSFLKFDYDNGRTNEFLQKNIDEYRQIGENSWRKECLEDLKRDEIIKLKQEQEMQERYKYKLRQHKYFSFFGER